MKRLFFWGLVLALAVCGYALLSGIDTPAATGKAAKDYKGTIFVAGMGGHFTKAEITIDPSSATPIGVTEMDRVVIGTGKTHPTHDARVDVNDKNVMFWSTYKLDPDGKVHVGKSDLKTGKVIKDVALSLDARAKWTGALYCGSGQSKKFFMPVTMTDEAYIDVFDKDTLDLKHRVFLDGLGYTEKTTKFFHGVNSPDLKKFAVSINLADNAQPNGKIDILLLDLPALEKGKAKLIAKTTVTGIAGKTLTFRQTFTPDGKYLLQSAGDRFYVFDGTTLALVDEEMVDAGQNHDAVPTGDGKYALLTVRNEIPLADGKKMTDGSLILYDVAARKLTGGVTSMCYSCHEKIGIPGNAVLCGADVIW